MKKGTDNWYASWFNTPYYHILYKDRDYTEAGHFMQALTSFLTLPPKSEILDLACGKGRHAKYLSELGYQVTGVDLSPSSIASAKKSENTNLHFEVHDMCCPFPKKFDAVFNLFTSFGYFEDEKDNLRTIKAIKEELKPKGHAVIDFLNAKYIENNIVPSEVKTVDGIEFTIDRSIIDGHILKDIRFVHDHTAHHYVERVRALTLSDFKTYFIQAGLTLDHVFGDYTLQPYDPLTSERLILIFS